MDEGSIGHVLQRFVLHLFTFAGIYLAVDYGVEYARRKAPTWTEQILPAVLIVAFIGWNEVGDLQAGQPYFKVFTDLASWIVGAILTIWGLRRFVKDNK